VTAYRATLDVPREPVWLVAKPTAERRRRGTPRGRCISRPRASSSLVSVIPNGASRGESMNSWLVWAAFVLAVLVLGLVGRYFSLRVLRVTAAFVTLATVLYVTGYGLGHPAKGAGSLSDAFSRGADALLVALFHPLPVPAGHHIPEPGRIGWLIIAALLVIGYRGLEAWSLHCHARCLDTSALTPRRQNTQQDDLPRDGKDALTDLQRHDRLAAELKFRLPAVEVRSPAILPGGSRSSELASIAETSGLTGSGLAGAIVRFFGMLWPSPRRIRVRVWVERGAGQAKIDDPARVTVSLDDPATGTSITTKTLAAGSLDDAASVVAGYVAQHIFAEDPTAPPWCIGAADGRDLAALLLARQVRVYPESEQGVKSARSAKIGFLESVAGNNLCAGVARYELAHLYDLEGRHVEALLLHAINREQYPRFFRGRYRLAMSLEMIANPDPATRMSAAEVRKLDDALKILHRCCATRHDKSETDRDENGKAELSAALRADLLDAACQELKAIRQHLTLWHVIWQSFWHRDERGILKPYWQLRYRQAFHDGVCVALLLVTVRQALNLKNQPGAAPTVRPAEDNPQGSARRLLRLPTVPRIVTAIAGDSSAIPKVPGILPGGRGAPGPAVLPMAKRLRTRRRPRQYSTRSWQAAYNLACVYAAMVQDRNQQLKACRRKREDPQAAAETKRIEGELRDLVTKVVTSLEFALNNPECEMERPSEWISHDPDFGCLHAKEDQFSKEFRDFLAAQKRRDYPSSPRNGVAGVVKSFNAAEGWGVIAAPEVPGDCLVHSSSIDARGYRELRIGQQVRFTYEDPTFPEDGCRFRALKVWPQT